jgi:hypothetical protein
MIELLMELGGAAEAVAGRSLELIRFLTNCCLDPSNW